jgi:hypothetical protein
MGKTGHDGYKKVLQIRGVLFRIPVADLKIFPSRKLTPFFILDP